jgi:hypothetical protein
MRGDESNWASRRLGSVDELLQRVEDDLDVLVMLIGSPFEIAELACQIPVVERPFRGLTRHARWRY